MIKESDIMEFRRKVDPQAMRIGYSHGVAVVLRNGYTTYYLHNIDEFWYKFGSYYPQIGGIGISVAKKELEDAKDIEGTPIIVIMMRNVTKGTLTFYGLNARAWYDFCETHQTWNDHSNKNLLNGSIPAKMLVNLEQRE